MPSFRLPATPHTRFTVSDLERGVACRRDQDGVAVARIQKP